MKVKKYNALSMTEALKKIREDLGTDAVILSSKPIFSGGFLGMFQKRSIEVIAGIDAQTKPEAPVQKQKKKKVPVSIAVSPRVPNDPSQSEKTDMFRSSTDLTKELSYMKELVMELKQVTNVNYPASLKPIASLLKQQGVDSNIQAEAMNGLLQKWYENHGEASDIELLKWMEEELLCKLEGVLPWGVQFQKKYINIVGPTGVGKTTTLAKAAAECILTQNKKVAFITTDTYRIAAIDQLKAYAKILGVPIEVAYNLDDFQKACELFSDYDVVFIDTAGRNFRNPTYVKELQKNIDFSTEMETYLVLSLTSKQRDMEEIYQQFSILPIKQVIFTKADETSSYGSMFNFLVQYKIGVSYITFGQNVPDDVEMASPRKLIKMMLGVKKYDGSS